MQTAGAVTVQLVMASGDIGATFFGDTPRYQLDPEAFKRQMQQLLQRERELAGDDPSINVGLDEVNSVFTAQYEFLKEFKAAGDEGLSTANGFVRLKKMKPAMRLMSHKLAAVLRFQNRQSGELEKALSETLANSERIHSQITAGVIADLVLTISLLIFFLTNVANRLNILVSIARAIPTRVMPSQRVGGNDELTFLERILHSVSDELKQAGEQRSAMTQMLVHDLRSPLLSSMLTLDALKEPEKFSSRAVFHGQISLLHGMLKSMVTLIEDLLMVEKLEAGKLELTLELFDIALVASGCVDAIASQAGVKNVSIVNNVEHIEVAADKLRITQVLSNLCSNALKFSPAGGKITLSSRIEPGFLVLSITDEGKGIPANKQASLFDRFFQVDRADAATGFGLGLSICKMLVSEHQGRIGVESEAGKGATFWFSLPVDPEFNE
jgi:signal transduction histidine kinase